MKNMNVLYWECNERLLLVSDQDCEYRVMMPMSSITGVSNLTMREYERNAEHKLETTFEQDVVVLYTKLGTLTCAFPPDDKGQIEAMKFFDALRNVL